MDKKYACCIKKRAYNPILKRMIRISLKSKETVWWRRKMNSWLMKGRVRRKKVVENSERKSGEGKDVENTKEDMRWKDQHLHCFPTLRIVKNAREYEKLGDRESGQIKMREHWKFGQMTKTIHKQARKTMLERVSHRKRKAVASLLKLPTT